MAFQDGPGFQNTNGAFNSLQDPNATMALLDPSMPYLQNPNAYDLGQFQNSALQPRMQNGIQRNASPAFHNPAYQVNPVVPSKRARPREDSLGASPRQAAGLLPASRSQTPQQPPYPNFQGNQRATPGFSVPTPYQHLQQVSSANASPSPVMQSQQFRPQATPQRVQTASPGPYSPAAQQFGAQMSPGQPEHSGRVQTPHTNAAAFGQGIPYSSGYNQQFLSPTGGMTSAGSQPGLAAPHVQLSQNLQHQQQNAQRLYQMRLQQQQQQMQTGNFGHTRQQSGSLSGVPGQPGHPNFQPGRTDKAPQKLNNPEQFMKTLVQFMHQRGLPLNTNPMIGDRPLNLAQLYAAVLRLGGSKMVTKNASWPSIATTLQFSPMQYPQAPQELQEHFERNLSAYEAFWWQMQQRQKTGGNHQHFQQNPAGSVALQPQISPTKQGNSQSGEGQLQQFMQQSQQQQMTPSRHTNPVENPAISQPSPNGFMAPQQNQNLGPAESRDRQQASYLPNQSDAPHRQDAPSPGSQQTGAFGLSDPAGIKPEGFRSGPPIQATQDGIPAASAEGAEVDSVFHPKVRSLDTYAGLNMKIVGNIGTELAHLKPTIPEFLEMGVIDIHALTMSLRSGIHAEVRLALDTLATLSVEPRFQLSLESCEDLVETLIDCAEDQLELLAENATEVSDELLISSYEDVVRGCRSEGHMLQDVPAVGTLEYELDRAVDRVICITTILRNLSFYEMNHALLTDPAVVKFLAAVIRYLGTRNMLLRSYTNTLDFMKDIIIYLSNLSQAIELPSKEEALCLLHFLLAFAPLPAPSITGESKLMFAPYQPSIHRYLPPAVDSLAKLLARDEPNRVLYKSIFVADATSTSSFDLLTRTFALAICPLPDNPRVGTLMATVDARKPYLIQGLLAAEILANIIPASENELAHLWLSSEDGFAGGLLRLVCLLGAERSIPPQRQSSGMRANDQDVQSYHMITHRGISVLRRLAERAQSQDWPSSKLMPSNIFPKMENLLGALLTAHIDSIVVRQLCAYAGLKL